MRGVCTTTCVRCSAAFVAVPWGWGVGVFFSRPLVILHVSAFGLCGGCSSFLGLSGGCRLPWCCGGLGWASVPL